MSKDYRMFSMPSAQCYVAIDEDRDHPSRYLITLVSYTTQVIHIYWDKIRSAYVMDCTGTYSATTSRHINRFTTEFFGESHYYACKRCAGEEVVTYADGKAICERAASIERVVNKYLTQGQWKRHY